MKELKHEDPRERLKAARTLAGEALTLPLQERAATVGLLADRGCRDRRGG